MSKVTKQEIIDALRDASSCAFYRDLSKLADRIEAEGIAPPSIDALIADAVAKEREACAQICDKYEGYSGSPMNFAYNCAEAIRARKQK